MKRFGIRKAIAIILMIILGIFVFGSIVMLLWNALLPVLFHFPVITFWQALGLLLLSKILFGGFRGPGGPRGGRWKDKMKQQWMNMSPEERADFRQRCGGRRKGPFGRQEFTNPSSPGTSDYKE